MSREDDIKRLIEYHNRRLQKLKEQEARYGISVDPRIPVEREDIEATIQYFQTELEFIEPGLDKYAVIWKDFRSKVEKVVPGAEKFFQVMDLLQQLSIPLYRELVIDLLAKCSGKELEECKQTLQEVEEHFLPRSDNDAIIKVIPVQCRTGFDLRDDSSNILIDALLQCQKLNADSELRGITYFNLGVTRNLQGSDFAFEAAKNFFEALSIHPTLACKLSRQHPTFVTRLELNQLEAKSEDFDKAYGYLYHKQ